jgi:thiol-disulfide isomerase/thioredoxin
MQTLRWGILVGSLGLCWLLAQETARTQEKEKSSAAVDLKVVKYEALADTIQKNRGKVIIVDFWANSCIPCKKAMPHLVELYDKHKQEGLTAITVAVDLAWGELTPAVQESLLKFLRARNATFTNVILDAPRAVLEEKLRVKAVPSVYVFNRAGQWTQFSDGIEPDKLDALVKKLLAERP